MNKIKKIMGLTSLLSNEEAADAVDSDYEYISNSKGIADFSVPDTAGEYDVRVYSSDTADAQKLIVASFTVL